MKGLDMFMNTEGNNLDDFYKKYFIRLCDAEEILYKELSTMFNRELFQEMIDKLLVVTILEKNDKYILSEELEVCKKILRLNFSMKSTEIEDAYCNGTF